MGDFIAFIVLGYDQKCAQTPDRMMIIAKVEFFFFKYLSYIHVRDTMIEIFVICKRRRIE